MRDPIVPRNHRGSGSRQGTGTSDPSTTLQLSKDSGKPGVQFGTASESSYSIDSPISVQDFDDISVSISSQNIRLRHEAQYLEESTQKKYFSKVTAAICTILLQICHQEVMIVRQMNKIPKVTINLEYVPLSEKYRDEEHDIDLIMGASVPVLTYKKFKKDVSWIEQVLWLIVVNLRKDLYYDDFLKILTDNELTKQEENMILSSKEFNRRELVKLRMYLEREKREWTKIIRDTSKDIVRNADILNDAFSESVVTLNYAKDWEKARHQQNKMKLQNQEDNFDTTNTYMGMETEKEERIHEEMWLYLENSFQDFKDGIEFWMEKYDTELDKREQYVLDMNLEREMLRDRYEKLLLEYNERITIMEEYKLHKMDLKREAARLERQTKAAMKIQAWWRGVMFRKRLGPYRRKKRKGAKKRSGKTRKR